MTSIELHPLPRFGQVIREQFKAIALSLRLPAIGVAFLATVVTMLAFADFLRGRGGVEFAPELSLIPAFAGLLLPIALWQSEKRFGPGFFWTLPVDRTRHALAKVFAGWLLLMIAVSLFVIWLLVLALVTEENITSEEIIRLLPTSTVPPPRTLDASMLRTVQWVPQPVLWLAPFFAATGTYALVSAIALGLRYPFRWLIGLAAGVFLIAAIGQGMGSDALALRIGDILESVFFGRYGVDGLLTARAESLKTVVELSSGEVVTVWRGLPVINEWITATLLWTGIGVAGLFAALTRHRERR
ncbi:MAG TPA: hypothetical protein VM939_10050 [Gemmatimonadaceae bacterium]|nr:hypothetical protein [Gemmatimonadaceae bacterium]